MNRVKITEYLDIEFDDESWVCNRCGWNLGPARENYKKGCLVYPRDPREVYPQVTAADLTFAPDPNWCKILEYYCPSCGIMLECEALPPGHPITHDLQIDIDDLKSKHGFSQPLTSADASQR